MRVENVCVVGMGYVGLTLSVVLAERGFKVFGVEVDRDLVRRLNALQPHFQEEGLDILLRKHLNKNLIITTQMPSIAQDAFIIAVGTPLNKETKQPIVDYVIRATTQVAGCIGENSLVVVRSTVPIGTCRNIILPILLQKKEKVYLAFCPERTAEGVALKELRLLPQIIGGLCEESVEKALDIFRRVTVSTVEVSSLEVAEIIKLLDNSYRDLTFAFANEIALFSEKLGLDAVELIKAANMGYPRTNLAVPGFVGGTCLSKDPHILVDSLGQVGYDLGLVKTARQVNEELPLYTADRVKEKLLTIGKDLARIKLLIAGLAFKGQPETDDIRDSPAIPVIHYFQRYTNQMYGHDFVVAGKDIRTLGLIPCSLEDGFREADAVIFMNNHKSYHKLDILHLACLMKKPGIIWDGWHLYDRQLFETMDGIIYGGLGFGR